MADEPKINSGGDQLMQQKFLLSGRSALTFLRHRAFSRRRGLLLPGTASKISLRHKPVAAMLSLPGATGRSRLARA